MSTLPTNVQKLVQYLERLPGLGPKSAARIAMYILKSPKNYAVEMADVIKDIKEKVTYCKTCFNLSLSDTCDICSDPRRDKSTICIVEDALDVVAFEQGVEFEGMYHVLGGVISPVSGIGPEDLRIKELILRLQAGNVSEVIISTNPNIEGEATAMYIRQEIKVSPSLKKLKITRLARGLPTGADLEYADNTTLKRAFEGRSEF
ncbi:MAG: recombination mediator RecR [Candidatus Dojkabacteria bacterium]|nr:recombination mediator RecR [Candidatus Dojkabacteria bacterium]